jgi:hypothetical protein
MVYKLFMVPRRTLVCEQILEQEGVLGNILYMLALYFLIYIHMNE